MPVDAFVAHLGMCEKNTRRVLGLSNHCWLCGVLALMLGKSVFLKATSLIDHSTKLTGSATPTTVLTQSRELGQSPLLSYWRGHSDARQVYDLPNDLTKLASGL
jgi:hypothetical protein